MKILFISMPSIHVIRWIENLKDTSYELYWFDVLGRGQLETLDSVHQFTAWKKRKLPYIKGEYFLSKRFPFLYETIQPFLEVTANEALEKIILEIQPDIVHSFEMQSCSYPILKTMQKYLNIKWLYSCWGNDLYYYQQFSTHLKKIKRVLQRIDFLHTDCQRDFELAKGLGFKGKFLGVIPGGTGYKINELEKYKLPIDERKVILVKGYENKFGRGLNVIKALEEIKLDGSMYEIVVFGAHQTVINYIENRKLNYKLYSRHELNHSELMMLMGKSFVYIGNNISDGMPNALLEAIVMGVFPIQSNPGGATAEIITHKLNGLLIEDPENIDEIKSLISYFVEYKVNSKIAQNINFELSRDRLDFEMNKKKVLEMYLLINN